MTLKELEKYLNEEPADFDQLCAEAYDKIDAILKTLELLGIEEVSVNVADKLSESIYVYDESRCKCCGLIGGH